jgi:biotin-(acetyl-CoA carboxylase) ligase
MEIDKIKRCSKLLKQVNNLEDIIDQWNRDHHMRITAYSAYINDYINFTISDILQEKIIELIKEEIIELIKEELSIIKSEIDNL